MEQRDSVAGAIEFWFDFSSGYAYFAAQEIEALGQRTNRSILWRPYMLGTAFKITGSRGLSATPLKEEYAHHDWQRIARLRGLEFSLPAHHPSVALAATRVFYWIEQHDCRMAVVFARTIFEEYFASRIDTSDLGQVASLAMLLGIDRQAVIEGAVQPNIKDRAKDLGEQAVTRGVFGSPFFIVDGEPFWGWDRMEMLERWIREGGW
jgi:2-hydroxychromene-2-carboxylate isomerase